MNAAQKFIAYAESHDIELTVIEGHLIMDGVKDEIKDKILTTAKEHKQEIITALERWNPELSAKGYQWCFDCKNWSGQSCTSQDNPYAEVEKCPQAARICKWYLDKGDEKAFDGLLGRMAKSKKKTK